MEEKTLAGENLECYFRPKICILYGNTVVRVWHIETFTRRHSKIPLKTWFLAAF